MTLKMPTETDSAVARTLQSSLLPEALPDVPGWEIAALYRPAGHESQVGGDFYDFWQVAGDWLMLIGDVTGKGVGAATVTSLVRHTAWAASDFDPRPAAVLAHVDAALKRRPSLSVCSALCLRISRLSTPAVGAPRSRSCSATRATRSVCGAAAPSSLKRSPSAAKTGCICPV